MSNPIGEPRNFHPPDLATTTRMAARPSSYLQRQPLHPSDDYSNSITGAVARSPVPHHAAVLACDFFVEVTAPSQRLSVLIDVPTRQRQRGATRMEAMAATLSSSLTPATRDNDGSRVTAIS